MNWIQPDWPLPAHVHAAVTLRNGGVSAGGYTSLNPASHVNDDPAHVKANRRILRDMLQLPAEPVWLEQVHGVRVIKADQAQGLEAADASFTDQSHTVCAVLTADCLPVLLCSDHGDLIAAVHAGWRGLQAGVLKTTLQAMCSKDISVWLGPAIGPNHFEVGDEVRTAFCDDQTNNAKAFKANGVGKWLADIYQLARLQLVDLGIDDIYGGDFCTVSEPNRFYSYPRDGATTGRMASLIWRD